MFSTRKRCLIGIPRVPKFLLPAPPKIGFGAQKRPNLAQNWHFGPNIGIFGPLDLMRDQKTMQTSCQSGFLLCWYQNFYLLPYKLGFLAQKWPNLVKNLHFWSFWAKYCHFLHILSNDRPKTMCTRCLGGFSVMWVTKLLISQVKKRIFCPKTTKFGPKLAFLVNLGQAMQAYSMPCCGSVGGCGARAVSRKTPIYFIINISILGGAGLQELHT